MARIRIMDEGAAAPEFQDIFKRLKDQGRPVLNLFRIMAHSPQVGLDFLRLGNSILLKGSVPPALRELAILRVGHLNRAGYEWAQHVPIAQRAGVRRAQIEALPNWEGSPEFDDRERAVLKYADEVTLSIRVTDQTFNGIRAVLNEEGIVELTTTIGYYGMVCRVLEALQIELEGKD